MTNDMITAPAELTEAELDLVAGGQGGLVNVTVGNNSIPVTAAVPVGVAANVLTSHSNASATNPVGQGVTSTATNPGRIL